MTRGELDMLANLARGLAEGVERAIEIERGGEEHKWPHAAGVLEGAVKNALSDLRLIEALAGYKSERADYLNDTAREELDHA